VGRDGIVNGFLCVLPVRLTFDGKPVRAAVASSLMVDEPEKNPLAGARLLRWFLKGPQDLSFSETSNEIARSMWERLGGRAAPGYSMEWVRPLRPASAAYALLRDAAPEARFLRPLLSVVDYAVGRRLPPVNAVSARAETIAADDPALLSLIVRLAGSYRLAPAWSHEDLSWLLRQAREKARFGPLVCKIVRGRKDRPLGCFLYYARPGGVAFVLQALAEPGEIAAVVDALLADARETGCVAVRGRTNPELLGPLQQRACLFVHRSSLTYHAKDDAVARAISSGEALLTGLCGESWTRLVGGFL
jgi:hypothetical protein